MSYTLDSIVEALGDEAQVGAGSVVVFREGRHILVAHSATVDGIIVTPEGLDILEGTTVTDDGTTVISEKQEAKTKATKGKAKAEVVVQDAEVVAPVETDELLADLDAALGEE